MKNGWITRLLAMKVPSQSWKCQPASDEESGHIVNVFTVTINDMLLSIEPLRSGRVNSGMK